MTDDERKASLARVADIFLLSLETVAEHFAMVVAGEKRLAVVPRKIPGRKANGGLIYELRMVKPEPPAALREKPVAPKFDPSELADLADAGGTDAAAAPIPSEDPELNIDEDLGDACCVGGPWWGHDEHCAQAVDPERDHAERKGLPLEPVDSQAELLAGRSFEDMPNWTPGDSNAWAINRDRYRK